MNYYAVRIEATTWTGKTAHREVLVTASDEWTAQDRALAAFRKRTTDAYKKFIEERRTGQHKKVKPPLCLDEIKMFLMGDVSKLERAVP